MQRRILIAEEQKECCELFQQFLERSGYEVTTVHDGVSCIEALLDGAQPEVLVLSWELSWGESEGVLDWIQDQGAEDTAVVVLTARMDPDSSKQESALERATWLQRPFRLQQLLDAIQSAERIPRSSWRCLEAVWKKNTSSSHGQLPDGESALAQP